MSADAILHELFGSDSEQESDHPDCPEQPGFISLPQVSGLTLVPRFIDSRTQLHYMECIDREGWFENGANQAMRFGDLPSWAQALAGTIPRHLFPSQIASREPLFDQVIVNLYLPGQGITSHVDLLKFQDGICSLSLGGPVIMNFTPVQEKHCPNSLEAPQPSSLSREQVLLCGGDLLMLHGEARYLWEHGIDSVQEELLKSTNTVIQRRKRVSITFRRLHEGIQLTEQCDSTCH